LFYQIKKDKVDGTCREPGRVEKCSTVLVRKTEKKRLFVENGHRLGTLT
jgi:hypothetical protein